MQHIIINAKTGGLDPTLHSLLSIALVKTSMRFQEIKSLHLRIRHSPFIVDAHALDAKGVDLREASTWDTPEQAKGKLYKFLGVTSDVEKPNGRSDMLYKLVGANVTFYIQFLQRFLGDDVYRKLFDTRPIEITSDYQLLQKCGVVPAPRNHRLVGMVEALGIPYNPTNSHDASYDAEIARQIAYQLGKRSTMLKDAFSAFVKRYGGDVSEIAKCYDSPEKTSKLLKTLKGKR
jgi:DNA polymerase III epsilon subunit-like protein